MKKIFLISLFIIGLVCGALGWEIYDFLKNAPSSDTTTVVFDLDDGTPFKVVVNSLKERGLITDTRKFYYLGRVTGLSKRIRSGEYALNSAMRPIDILKVLISGKSIEYNFVVPEGYNIFEISKQWQEQGFGLQDQFLKACFEKGFIESLLGEKVTTLEGYLFPETYKITRHMGERGLIRMMVKRFLEVYRPLEPFAQKMNMSRREVVTLASIIEKETGAPEERAKISSVFHNRLHKQMRLQTDPTVLYGIWMSGDFGRMNITRDDLQTPSDYNTYTFKGLPKGPISNPGRDALVAAMNPANTDYLYFVSRNNGTHVFSSDYLEHQNAVRRFQLNSKAREGHSWRELKKGTL